MEDVGKWPKFSKFKNVIKRREKLSWEDTEQLRFDSGSEISQILRGRYVYLKAVHGLYDTNVMEKEYSQVYAGLF